MFRVKFSFVARIKDCPLCGIDAAEWREEHDLPPSPTLDPSADIDLFLMSDICGQHTVPTSLLRGAPILDADILRPFIVGRQPPEDPTAALNALWAALLDEQAPRRAAITAELDRIEAAGPLIHMYGRGEWGIPLRPRYAEAARAACRAEVARQREEKAAAQAAADEQVRAEMSSWAEEHGSPRLRRLLMEEIECRAVYLTERRHLEYPGWRRHGDIHGEDRDPRNPSELALALLDEARASCPAAAEAVLRYWVAEAEGDEGDDDYRAGWTGYVAFVKDDRLGYLIYGGPRS